MIYGNCLLYALWMRLLHGGRIRLTWTSTRVQIPRFWHVSRDGQWSRFAPVARRSGWWAVLHKLWFRGEVKTWR